MKMRPIRIRIHARTRTPTCTITRSPCTFFSLAMLIGGAMMIALLSTGMLPGRDRDRDRDRALYTTTIHTHEHQHEPDWTFIVIADSHSFTESSWTTHEDIMQRDVWIEKSAVVSHIQQNYGGELVLLPGDMVSYGRFSTSNIIQRIGGTTSSSDLNVNVSITPEEAVYRASRNSGNSTRTFFHEAGYDTLLASIGDHEIGGNEGFKRIGHKKSKIQTIPMYRRGFGDGYNRNERDEFIFDQMILGDVPSRPMGTPYENTTFAYVHKNVLFITIDAFELIGDGSQNYLDRENGLGGEGAVTCTVSGEHLAWLDRILRHGKNNPDTIRHILVQAHLPIIQPVQKVDSSGQFFDAAEESELWNVMNAYGVDIYFAGDVHATTATKSRHDGSNLVQIVSRGVGFNNFLTVDISEHVIDVHIYNEYGTKKRFNGQYNASGRLTIDKSNAGVTELSSSGMLELVKLESEILSYNFEEILPLGTRQVISMRGDDTLMATERTIRNEVCKESIMNHGGFGAQYDAQVCNIDLVEGRNKGESAGLFGERSRFGVYGSGPFSGGEMMSFGIWIKTKEAAKNMILVHHGPYWGKEIPSISDKDHFILALELGVLVIHTQPTISLKASDRMNITDDKWHHVAVSMPRKSCRVSELEMYVDGRKVNTSRVQYDRPIFQTTAGRMSLGGYGYSQKGFEDAYPDRVPYMGVLDDFVLYARPLQMETDFPSLFINQESNPSQDPVREPVEATSSIRPSQSPSMAPSSLPSQFPTRTPSLLPSQSPSWKKSGMVPSSLPSQYPNRASSSSLLPSQSPRRKSMPPSQSPNRTPSSLPSPSPSPSPSRSPDMESPSPSQASSSIPSSTSQSSMSIHEGFVAAFCQLVFFRNICNGT